MNIFMKFLTSALSGSHLSRLLRTVLKIIFVFALAAGFFLGILFLPARHEVRFKHPSRLTTPTDLELLAHGHHWRRIHVGMSPTTFWALPAGQYSAQFRDTATGRIASASCGYCPWECKRVVLELSINESGEMKCALSGKMLWLFSYDGG